MHPAGLEQTVQLINEAARTEHDTEYHRGERSAAGVMGRHYLGSGASIGSWCAFGYIAANDVARL